jgi:hypothetical protein
LIEAQRVLDAIAGERIDHQPLLVGRDDFLRGRFEIENAPVDCDDVVDERHLEIQARLVNDPNRITQPNHQRLLSLIDCEQRRIAEDQRRQNKNDDNAACESQPH